MQGLLLPHIAPPPFSLSSFPIPPRPLSSFLVSLNSPSTKLSSNLFLRHPSSGFSRCSNRWYSKTCSFDRHLQRNSQKTDDLEIWHFRSHVCKTSTALDNDIDDLCACHESRENCTSGREFYVASIVSSPSISDCMKFMFLFGLFTLQDSLPAVAGGLQTMPYLGDLGDISTSFASAFLLIFFSELGDKTFFIAALLAARNSAAVVFAGTFGALAVNLSGFSSLPAWTMTIISVVLGRTFHYVDEILPFRLGGTDLPIDDIAAVCLLVYFGISTLLDASSNDGLKAEDEQKEAELAISKVSGNGAGVLTAANTVISSFLLVFVAEWGDKSFFSTIALAAASSPLGVIGGALAGHGLATLIAVLGGSLLGSFLSEKVIGYTGGVLFLIFAGLTLIEIVR